jgi:hypothetical protein
MSGSPVLTSPQLQGIDKTNIGNAATTGTLSFPKLTDAFDDFRAHFKPSTLTLRCSSNLCLANAHSEE